MIRLAVRCRPELAEQVLAELVELAPSGVEERRGDGHVELAIYGAPGEIPELPDVEAAAGEGLIEVTTTEVADDWADRWRDFHRPVAIAGGRIVVRPPWSAATDPQPVYPAAQRPATPRRGSGGRPQAPRLDVVIDPGQAFGTGAHHTTRLCLELMLDFAGEGGAGGPFVDLGTGSAVLAIVAAKLGWAPVLGADNETAALDAARGNAEANGVELDLRRVNLRRDSVPLAPTVVANLTAPLLLEVAARLRAGDARGVIAGAEGRVPRPRMLICSGLLAREADRVARAFGTAGLTEVDRRTSGEWTGLRLAA